MRFIPTRTITKNKKLPFMAGIALALVGLFAISGFATSKVSAYVQDCDNNSIIKCGYSSPANFIAHVQANDSLNGHHDLQTLYAAYGLGSGDYGRFASSARPGVAYKDGRVVVDGQVVATGGASIGREASRQGPGYFTTQQIGGVSYYGNTNANAFGNDALPVYAIFNAQGKLQFSVLQGCGNPEFGTPVVPAYNCQMLNMTAVSGKANTYNFSTAASANNNASIAKCVYDFGDGATATVTNCAQTLQHQYTKAGSFSAKVTVYVNLPGGQQATIAPAGQCIKAVPPVTIPYYQCVQLAGSILDKSKFSYSFVATAKYGNGAKFLSADFNFGDGKTVTGVKPNANGTTVTANHSYAAAGNYSASAMLHFSVNGATVTAPTCRAAVTPTKAPTPECKPGVPVGSPECTPCQYDTSLPSNSPQCLPPTLPNTGAGNVVAIFAAAVVGSFLIYRQILFRRHKAAFAAAEQGTSDLPLADPLATQAPLTGTPLARRVKSLRRKRPF